MKKLLLTIFLTVSFGVFADANAQSVQTLVLKVGQESMARGNVRVKFVEVIDDSRCPKGTTCIWAGTANIRMKARKGRGPAKDLTVDMSGPGVEFQGYRIKLIGLTPHPANNIRVNRLGYKATVSISKI